MKIRAWIKGIVCRPFQIIMDPMYGLVEKQILLQSQTMSDQRRSMASIPDLSAVEYSAFSQWGEDGIIDWLVARLPEIPETFIEFGVSNYRESNTRLLIQLRNWSGLIMDGSMENIENIKSQEIYWKYDLNAKHAFISKENINSLISEAGYSGDIGILSIDIDGNDYWVWEAINVISPAIVICEYNAVFGDLLELSVPYDPLFQRTNYDSSNLCFGASIKALTALGAKKGYKFIGTTSSGVNAFFVRRDLAENVLNSIDSVAQYPSKTRESRDKNGELTFLSGAARGDYISSAPIWDMRSSAITTIAECGSLESEEWALGKPTRHLTISVYKNSDTG